MQYIASLGAVVRIVPVRHRALVQPQAIQGQVVRVVHPHQQVLYHSCHAALVQVPHYLINLLQAKGNNCYYYNDLFIRHLFSILN